MFVRWTVSDLPGTAHGLVDKPVGRLVVDEELFHGVEMQRAVQSQGACTHVDQCAAAVPDLFVEGESLPCMHAFDEIRILRFGIGQLGEFLHDIGNRAAEPLVHLAQRAFDVGRVLLALESFSFENDLAAVLVGIGDLPPDTYGIGVGASTSTFTGEVRSFPNRY